MKPDRPHEPGAAFPGQAPVFEAFERQGVRYCLLRVQIGAGVPEIDLLVDQQQLTLLQKILRDHGYCPVLSWGHAPHSFFVGFDPGGGRWVKFDVVTDIRYGQPIRALSPDLAAESLRYRRARAGIHVLAPEHALIKLLLHCLMHERRFETADCGHLEAYYGELRRDPAAQAGSIRIFDACLAPALAWNLFQRAAETADWASLLKRRRAVAWQLFRRDPLRTVARYLAGRLLRLLRPLWIAARCPGASVALLGPDGAGKSTLARHLANDPFIGARIIYMGTNPEAGTVAAPGARRLQSWAKRSAGGHRTVFSGLRRTVAFAGRLVDQWFRHAVARYHRRRGRFVVFDRFLYDDDLALEAPSFLARLRRCLLRAGCPRPDLVVLLDAPAAILHARKKEDPLDKIERQRAAYLRLKSRLPRLVVVDTTGGDDHVRREVTGLLWERYRFPGKDNR